MKALSLRQVIHEISARKGPRTGSFEFDEGQLRLICQSIVKKINQNLENDIPIKSKSLLRIKSPIDKKEHQIKLKINQIEDPELYARGSVASWDDEFKEIIMNIPDSTTWLGTPENEWEETFYKNLVHELTHAFDIEASNNPLTGNLQISGDNKNYHNYFNDRAETKAFIAQIGAEIKDLLGRNIELKKMRPERLIQLSPTWTIISKFYKNNPKATKMFLKSVFDITHSV